MTHWFYLTLPYFPIIKKIALYTPTSVRRMFKLSPGNTELCLLTQGFQAMTALKTVLSIVSPSTITYEYVI